MKRLLMAMLVVVSLLWLSISLFTAKKPDSTQNPNPTIGKKYTIFYGVYDKGKLNKGIHCKWRGKNYISPICVERTGTWCFTVYTVIMGDSEDKVSIEGYGKDKTLFAKVGGIQDYDLQAHGKVAASKDIMVSYYSTKNRINAKKVNTYIESNIIPGFLKAAKHGYVKDQNGVLQFKVKPQW